MADTLARAAQLRPRTSTTPSEQHFAAHNALSLAMLYLHRENLPAARRKAVQALAALKQLGGRG